ARAPLFERLSDPGAGSPSPTPSSRVLDTEALRDQVRGEILRLLNTRRGLPEPLSSLASDTVLAYGLADFSPLTASSDTDRNQLAETIAQLVRAHEPRLAEVRVVLQPVPGKPTAIAGVIMGKLKTGLVPEPVAFHLTIDARNPDETIALV